MEYKDFVSQRITELRMQKNISARDMSLSLGQSESYINKIENRRALPSLQGLFYICEFFDITPAQFFAPASAVPTAQEKLLEALSCLPQEQVAHLLLIVEDLLEK